MIKLTEVQDMRRQSAQKRIYVGYNYGQLIPGYNFLQTNNPLLLKLINVCEHLNGTKKQRHACQIINAIGYTVFENYNVPVLRVGLKWYCPEGLVNPDVTLATYKKILEECLAQTGWQNISQKQMYDHRTDYYIPLLNPHNLQNLIKLSDSIGFYYKSARPNLADITKIRYQSQIIQAHKQR